MNDLTLSNNFICPECSTELKSTNCNCGWTLAYKKNVPILLSNRDRKSEVFSKYLYNYDTIAQDDLSNSIQHPEYLEVQSQKLFEYVLPLNLKEKTILEMGVGKGILLNKILKKNPKKYYALDISADYLGKLEANNTLVPLLANAENIPFNDKFDMVIATDLLEHVLNVGDFIVSLNRAVKMGGLAVIRVPYLENLIQYSKLRGCPYEFVHLRTFDSRTLEMTLNQAGFEKVKFHYDGFQLYRMRQFWQKYPKIKKFITEKMIAKFGSQIEVARINNHIGRIFMQPLELTIIARKTHNI